MFKRNVNPFSKTGRQVRQIKITPDIANVLNHQLELFRQKFGRDPGPGDPIFFDPDADQPSFLSETQQKQIEDAMYQVILKANINPAFAYAFCKTGRLLTTENEQYASAAAIAEWEAAVAEYQSHGGSIQ